MDESPPEFEADRPMAPDPFGSGDIEVGTSATETDQQRERGGDVSKPGELRAERLFLPGRRYRGRGISRDSAMHVTEYVREATLSERDVQRFNARIVESGGSVQIRSWTDVHKELAEDLRRRRRRRLHIPAGIGVVALAATAATLLH
jgi:hypothetical protein